VTSIAIAGVRVGLGKRLGEPRNAGFPSEAIERRFEQAAARAELVVDGDPGHAGGFGHRVDRERCAAAQHRRRRGQHALARFGSRGFAARALVGAGLHGIGVST